MTLSSLDKQVSPVEVKFQSETGTFEGYASLFDVIDTDGDVFERGAFEQSLQQNMPVMLWQHNMKEPIGRFLDVKEDTHGLYVKGQLSLEGRGKEAYSLLKMGAVNGLSVGFICEKASQNNTSAARHIQQAKLMEISLVTFPANEQARVATLKHQNLPFQVKSDNPHTIGRKNNLPTDRRSFEAFLREQGFTRKAAKVIASRGFSQDHMQMDMVKDQYLDAMIQRLSKANIRRTHI